MTNNVIDRVIKREEKKKEMFSNYDYIDWLISFTEIYDSFTADDYEYRYLILKEKDNENLKNFYIFFDGIEGYANDNFIYPKYSGNGAYYTIKYGDVALNIGVEVGQGTLTYCERTEPSEEDIEFSDIMEGKESPRKDIINNKLNEILESINTLVYEGVPFNFILSELKKKNNEKNNEYTKKKVK